MYCFGGINVSDENMPKLIMRVIARFFEYTSTTGMDFK